MWVGVEGGCGGGGWLEECVTVRRHPIFLFIVGVILVMVHKGLSVLSLMCSVWVCVCVSVCVTVCKSVCVCVSMSVCECVCVCNVTGKLVCSAF